MWNDHIEEEDMYRFMDVLEGADELDGEYVGPVFYRQWRIDRSTVERALFNMNEKKHDPSLFGSEDEAWTVYQFFTGFPLGEIDGEWTVVTYNRTLMHLYRNNDEPDTE